jgi:hypothetical protein
MKTVFFGVCPQDLDRITLARIRIACNVIIEESDHDALDRSLCDIDTANCENPICYCRKGIVHYERRKARALPALDDQFWHRWQRCFDRKNSAM